MSNCPNVLSYGTCSDSSCPHVHNIQTCEPCSLVFSTNEAYQEHLGTVKHLNRTSGRSLVSHCSICKANITGGETQFKQHIRGRKHISIASTLGISSLVVPQAASSTGKETFCELCQVVVPNQFFNLHVKGDRHASRETFTKYTSAIVEAESDKNDVSVEGMSDFDFVAPEIAKSGIQREFTIRTTQPFGKCSLVSAKLASSQGALVAHTGCVVFILGLASY